MAYTQPASILASFTGPQQTTLLDREDKIGRLFAAGTTVNAVNTGTRMCPFYYPLPSDAPVAADSVGIMSAWVASATDFMGLNRTGYSVPVKIVSDADPAPSFTQRTPNTFLAAYMATQNIRIPAGWDYPYAGQDEGAEFLHVDGSGNPDTLLSVHGFQRVDASTVTYNNAGIIQVSDAMGTNPYLYRTGAGVFYDVHPQPGFMPGGDWKYAPGAAGSRIPYAPTKIRAGEVALGRIDHAMMIIIDLNMIRAGFSYPAAWTDGAGTTANRFREGQIVRIPAAFDIDAYAASHPNLSRLGKIVLRAAQEHGFVLGDRTSAGTITVSSDSADELGFDPWPILDAPAGAANPLRDFPWQSMQVLAADYDPAAEAGATFTPRSTDIAGNIAPTVSLSGPATIASGAGDTITATASDTDGTIASYAWGTTAGVLSGTGASVTLTNDATASERTATVTCTVTDDAGATAVGSLAVSLLTGAPIALYGGRAVLTVDTGTNRLPAVVDLTDAQGVPGGVQAALDAKADTTALATVATSGGWSDVTGKPTINGTSPDGSGNYTIAVGGAETLATAPAGSVFRCPWNGSAWTYNGTAMSARPSTRTEIFFGYVGAPAATADPAWALAGDWREDV